MTLIAAFKCREGVILCSDSLETLDGVPIPVHKLRPIDCRHYWLAVGGSGNGDLIDGFVENLRLDVEAAWQPQHSESVMRGLIRNVLLDYHENEIKLYPTLDETDRRNDFLVCIQPKGTPDVWLWELRGSVVVSAGNYSLIGINEGIYKYEIRRLSPESLTKLQAMLLGIHLLTLASETSNYVGGEMVVIFVNENGMQIEPQETVRYFEDRVIAIDKGLSSLLLGISDYSRVSDATVQAGLTAFKHELTRLREHSRSVSINATATISSSGIVIPASSASVETEDQDND